MHLLLPWKNTLEVSTPETALDGFILSYLMLEGTWHNFPIRVWYLPNQFNEVKPLFLTFFELYSSNWRVETTVWYFPHINWLFLLSNLCTNLSAVNGSKVRNKKYGKRLMLNSIQCSLLMLALWFFTVTLSTSN